MIYGYLVFEELFRMEPDPEMWFGPSWGSSCCIIQVKEENLKIVKLNARMK